MEKMMNLSVVEPGTRMIDLQKNSTSYYNSPDVQRDPLFYNILAFIYIVMV